MPGFAETANPGVFIFLQLGKLEILFYIFLSLALVFLADFNAADFSGNCFRQFLYKFKDSRTFVHRSVFLCKCRKLCFHFFRIFCVISR